MMKNLIEKEITEFGRIYLHVKFRNTNDFLSFEDETEFQAFVFMLRMMTSMNAATVSVECAEPAEPGTTKVPMADDEDQEE
jgi:hypothetical protein